VLISSDCAAQTPTLGYVLRRTNTTMTYLSQTVLHAIVEPIDEMHWEKELTVDKTLVEIIVAIL
jgi:hypothetical protein